MERGNRLGRIRQNGRGDIRCSFGHCSLTIIVRRPSYTRTSADVRFVRRSPHVRMAAAVRVTACGGSGDFLCESVRRLKDKESKKACGSGGNIVFLHQNVAYV